MADSQLKYSDFVKPDESITNLIAQLEELLKHYGMLYGKIKADAQDLEKSMKSASTATDTGRKAIEKATAEADKLAAEYEKLTAAQSDTANELAKLRAEQQKQNAVNKLTEKFNNSLEGSYDKLSAQYSLNVMKLNAMSKAERELSQEGLMLTASTKDVRNEMKRLKEETEDHRLSVGDYEKGWRGLVQQMSETNGAAGSAAQGIGGLDDAAKKLLANPIVLMLSILAATLYGLFSLFKRTESGADLMAKATGALNAVLSIAVGVTDKLYKAMLSAFENPQQALKNLGEAIVKQVLNRLNSWTLIAKAAGQAMQALASRDMAALEQAGKDAGTALIQMTTGLDAQQQREFGKAIADTTEEIKAQTAAFVALEASRRGVRKENRNLQRALEEVITKEELAKAVADDATKSFKEREAANKEAQEATIERAKLETKIASNNLGLISREIDMRSKNGENVEELLDAQLGAYSQLKAAQRSYLLAVRDNEKIESELKQDRLEKDLDILIDGFEAQQAINLAIANDTTLTEQERRKKIEETRALAERSFAKQMETIQQFTGISLDSTALITEADAVALNQKIRAYDLSEVIEGRLLEAVNGRKNALVGLSEAEKKLAADKLKAEQDELKLKKESAAKQYDSALVAYEQEKELRISEIDLMQVTEAEKTKLKLAAEKDRLEKMLKLNADVEGRMTDMQVAAARNTIKKLEAEIAKAGGGENKDLYAALGFDLDDEQKQAVSDSLKFIKTAIVDLLDARIAAIDASLEKSQEEKSEIQSRYDLELENRANGLANNAAQVQKELELNKAKEDALLKQKAKAQKAKELIDTATQISSLITASSEIWASLSGIPVVGPVLAVAAIAAMFGSFAISKIKAKAASKQQYGDGGFEFLDGGSHASGNDIPIGMTANGKQRTAEGGEALAVINKKNTRKYKHLIPTIVDSLNAGNFEKHFADSAAYATQIMSVSDATDTSTMEKRLEQLVSQGNARTYTDERGRLVEIKNNLKRTYV